MRGQLEVGVSTDRGLGLFVYDWFEGHRGSPRLWRRSDTPWERGLPGGLSRRGGPDSQSRSPGARDPDESC